VWTSLAGVLRYACRSRSHHFFPCSSFFFFCRGVTLIDLDLGSVRTYQTNPTRSNSQILSSVIPLFFPSL